MNKKTIIYIACAVALAFIITLTVYFVVIANKTKNTETQQKIIITKYDQNFEVEKTIEITDKKQFKEINEMFGNPSLEQNEDTLSYAIMNDVKLDLGNGKFFIIQLDLKQYCYYEDTNTNTKLVINMPDGLLEKVNEFLK